MQSRVNKLLDPKVRAILAQIDKEGARKQKEKDENEKLPPKTFDEFLKYYNLKDWPERVLQEQDSGKAARALVLGSQDDIEGIFKDAAPLALDMLTKLEDRLTQLEEVLQSYADKMIADGEDKEGDQDDRPFQSPNRTFLTETAEAHARSLVSTMSISQKSQQDYAERLLERKKKTVENGIFPGFRPKELVELPAQIESPPILHRVTKAQDFNVGFKKFWKKIFLSEASVAVMQDTFWWIFIDKFKKATRKEKQVDKDLLFDRIADSFVALFHSINTDVKDKFLMAYPGCLAQALFITFCEAFPESKTQFDSDSFKQYIVDLVFEWTSGVKVLPGLYKSWDVPRLLRKGGKEQDTVEAAKQMLEAKQNTDKKKSKRHSMDLSGFERMISKLGENLVGDMSREPTQLTATTTTGQMTKHGQSQQSSVKVVPGLDEEESHQIGPGADLERVKFNLQGRSPLVAHYLHKRQLQSFNQAGKKVRRTEVAALPPPGLTYREVINNTLSMSETLSQEYHKICERTNAEIMELEKQKKDTNREIDKLQRELLFTKNSIEMKILSDKIMAIKDRDKNKAFFSTEAAAGQAVAFDSEEEETEDF